MKQILTSKLLPKVFVLLCLLTGLSFAATYPATDDCYVPCPDGAPLTCDDPDSVRSCSSGIRFGAPYLICNYGPGHPQKPAKYCGGGIINPNPTP